MHLPKKIIVISEGIKNNIIFRGDGCPVHFLANVRQLLSENYRNWI